MHRSNTPKPASDARAAADLLRSAFQAEIDAIHRGGSGPKGEVYKPPAGSGGAWGAAATQPKPGKLADGSDFVQQLAASLDQVPAS
ncbi:hypothetical protein JCM8208_004350 [Rhodotorula glutinis]